MCDSAGGAPVERSVRALCPRVRRAIATAEELCEDRGDVVARLHIDRRVADDGARLRVSIHQHSSSREPREERAADLRRHVDQRLRPRERAAECERALWGEGAAWWGLTAKCSWAEG